jgi:WD40 repeat protein
VPRYDAFVSYSHAGERELAQRLQAGVERFTKPWYRTRSLRLFLDTNSLTASPGLWPSIETALADSRWLVLIASEQASRSPWIQREIDWWLENRSAKSLLIAVAGGQLVWDHDRNDFDPETSSALPSALQGALDEEPLWVEIDGGDEPSDEQLRGAVIDVAAPLKGISKEKLVAAAERERRRTLRWVLGVITGLSILLLAAVVAGVIALNQRSTALTEATLAESRQVASASEAVAGENLSTAMLLAVEAYRMDPNAQTRAALFSADTTSPHLERFVDASGEVVQLAGSNNGRSTLAALANGRVMLWEAGDRPAQQLFRLPRKPSGVTINDNGSVVAAADASRCLLWRRGEHPVRLPVAVGLHCDSVGVSPSGRTVVYHAEAPNFGEGNITVASVGDLSKRISHPDPLPGTSRIVVPSDKRVLLGDPGAVIWRQFSNWSGGKKVYGGFGAHTYESAISGNGGLFIVSNGAAQVPILRTNGSADARQPDFSVDVPLPDQKTLALSPDGSQLAVAGPGEIYVAPVTQSEAGTLEPNAGHFNLTGQNATIVAFAGESHLLSATGDQIAFWDTGQLDRLAHITKVPLEPTCELCGGAKVSISPDSKHVAVVNDSGASGFVQSLSGSSDLERLHDSSYELIFGAPIWQGDSKLVAIPAWPVAGGISAPPPNLDEDAVSARVWDVDGTGAEAYELVEGPSPDGKTAIIVNTEGTVLEQRLTDGKVLRSSSDPAATEGEESASSATISRTGLLAIAGEHSVRIEQLPSRHLVNRLATSGYGQVAFAGDHLLVQGKTGNLEVWSENGSERQQMIGGIGLSQVIGSPDGRLAATVGAEDGMIHLVDLETGGVVATFETPAHLSALKTGLAFSPDGKRLVAVSELLSSEIADLDPDTAELVSRELSDTSLVSIACKAAGKELTATEWQALVGTDPPSDLRCQ